jgi:hypothetical protein
MESSSARTEFPLGDDVGDTGVGVVPGGGTGLDNMAGERGTGFVALPGGGGGGARFIPLMSEEDEEVRR